MLIILIWLLIINLKLCDNDILDALASLPRLHRTVAGQTVELATASQHYLLEPNPFDHKYN